MKMTRKTIMLNGALCVAVVGVGLADGVCCTTTPRRRHRRSPRPP